MRKFIKSDFDESQQMVEESLFSIGNGYVGLRGSFEEGYPMVSSIRGTYINGLYDRVPMVHAEMAFGFPIVQDVQPRIIDTQTCEIYLEGEKVQLKKGQYQNYQRWLDYQHGEAIRVYEFITGKGKTAKIKFRRMASFCHLNFVNYRIEVEFEGQIEMVSVLDGKVENESNPNDPRLNKGHGPLMEIVSKGIRQDVPFILMRTKSTLIEQATFVSYHTDTLNPYTETSKAYEDKVITSIVGKGQLSLEKKVVFTDGLRFEEPFYAAEKLISEYKEWRYSDFIREQEIFLEKYWKDAGIKIKGNENDQAAINFMTYHLLQSFGRDEYANVSAKGLSGEGYEGHYFWDTEIYILPVLLFSHPEYVKKILSFRHRILPDAIERSRMMGHLKGAAFPWRTISGIECSGYFPAGTAQYHINADIAYSYIQHHLYTNDWEFMVEKGIEVIFESARTWLEVGHYYKGKFNIYDVTGPDEYTAIVNNNYFTNVMAKHHLYWCHKLFNELQTFEDEAIKLKAVVMFKKINYTKEEAENMKLASEKMALPYDEDLKFFAQDDSFLSKPFWPFEKPQYNKRPLLLHYHPLTIYRHQVLKQPDVLLAHFLLEEDIETEQIRNAYDYYEKITTHDSSLSSCLYGIMASKCRYKNKAYEYFQKTIELDLKDTHQNTKDGLHMANMAGSLLSIIAGFAGLRVSEKGLSINPFCPEQWEGYRFNLKYLGREIQFSIDQALEISLVSGESMPIIIEGESYRLCKEKILKKTLLPFKGVIFDLDGVLTETSRSHFQAWYQLAEELGYHLPDEIEDEVRGISRLASLEIVLKAGNLEKSFSEKEKNRLADYKNEIYLNAIKDYNAENLFEGTIELLSLFKKNGYRIGLASSSRSGNFLINAMGIDSYFDAIVNPAHVHKGKPAPDIFLLACEQIGLEPWECIGIEDSYAGIEGIKSAGLTPIGIGSDKRLSNCNKVFPSIKSLYSFLNHPNQLKRFFD